LSQLAWAHLKAVDMRFWRRKDERDLYRSVTYSARLGFIGVKALRVETVKQNGKALVNLITK